MLKFELILIDSERLLALTDKIIHVGQYFHKGLFCVYAKPVYLINVIVFVVDQLLPMKHYLFLKFS
jgi:hypothetical protein